MLWYSLKKLKLQDNNVQNYIVEPYLKKKHLQRSIQIFNYSVVYQSWLSNVAFIKINTTFYSSKFSSNFRIAKVGKWIDQWSNVKFGIKIPVVGLPRRAQFSLFEWRFPKVYEFAEKISSRKFGRSGKIGNRKYRWKWKGRIFCKGTKGESRGPRKVWAQIYLQIDRALIEDALSSIQEEIIRI